MKKIRLMIYEAPDGDFQRMWDTQNAVPWNGSRVFGVGKITSYTIEDLSMVGAIKIPKE